MENFVEVLRMEHLVSVRLDVNLAVTAEIVNGVECVDIWEHKPYVFGVGPSVRKRRHVVLEFAGQQLVEVEVKRIMAAAPVTFDLDRSNRAGEYAALGVAEEGTGCSGGCADQRG